jgi:hypothetical protein
MLVRDNARSAYSTLIDHFVNMRGWSTWLPWPSVALIESSYAIALSNSARCSITGRGLFDAQESYIYRVSIISAFVAVDR